MPVEPDLAHDRDGSPRPSAGPPDTSPPCPGAPGQHGGQASPPASAAARSRRAIPVKKTSLPPFKSRSLTALLYRPSAHDGAVARLRLNADATGARRTDPDHPSSSSSTVLGPR